MVTGAGAAPGLPMVTYSSKSGSTLPSARYQARAGTTPKASVAPLTEGRAATAKGKKWSKYTGRSTSTGTLESTRVEKPTTPDPTPSDAELASMVWREEGATAAARPTGAPPPRARTIASDAAPSPAVGAG